MLPQFISFEIHITIANLPKSKFDLFVRVCVQNIETPLLIELYQGDDLFCYTTSGAVYLRNKWISILLTRRKLYISDTMFQLKDCRNFRGDISVLFLNSLLNDCGRSKPKL